MEELRKGSLYLHYKNRWYYVLDKGINSETREEYVIYFPLYEDKLMLFARPYSMFLEKVNGKLRFTPSDLTEITDAQKHELLEKASSLLKTVSP